MLHFPNVGLIAASPASSQLQPLLIYAVNVATGRISVSEGAGATDQPVSCLLCVGGPCGSHEGLAGSTLQPLEGANATAVVLFHMPMLILIALRFLFFMHACVSSSRWRWCPRLHTLSPRWTCLTTPTTPSAPSFSPSASPASWETSWSYTPSAGQTVQGWWGSTV